MPASEVPAFCPLSTSAPPGEAARGLNRRALDSTTVALAMGGPRAGGGAGMINYQPGPAGRPAGRGGVNLT